MLTVPYHDDDLPSHCRVRKLHSKKFSKIMSPLTAGSHNLRKACVQGRLGGQALHGIGAH